MAGRYEILGRLGEGATAVVERAFDHERGHEVALKRLKPTDATARLLFQHEYWALRRLDHPGLVRALDHEADQFTMELAPGTAPRSRQDPAAVPGMLAAVLRVLAYLHHQGLVHGDLKPENLRFTPDGGFKLLDLGFLQQAGRPGLRRGTPAYMAPEVIRGEPADPRSDLYALGAIAYEWLAGQPPFTAQDPLGLARLHLEAEPAPLTGPLAGVVARCLAKEPGDRPASAARLLRELTGEALDEALVFGSELFGREAERAALQAGVAAQLAGDGSAVVVHGAAGMGKTRLLLAAEGVVLRVAAGADVPFELVGGLLAEAEALLLTHGVDPGDPAWQALRALRPAWGPPPPPLDSPNHEARLRQALSVLLDRLAGQAGVVVAIDDWDRADAASRDLLAPMAMRPGAARAAWVLSTREAPEGGGIALGPLEARALAELAATALGEPPEPALLERLLADSGGNPGRAQALLRHWAVQGALRPAHGRWTLDAARSTALPPAAAALPALSAEALAAAGAAAILGRAFALVHLAALLAGEPFGPLAELEAAGVLMRQGDRARFEGEAYEAALAALDPATARALHGRAAALLAGATDLGGLTQHARHALAAGLPAAVDAALAAARAAIDQGALATADELLAALEARPELFADDAQREEAARLPGDLARVRGEGERARACYERAIALARAVPLPHALLRELVSAGRTAMMMSQAERARELLGEALALARELGDQALEARALMALGRVDFFAGHAAPAREAYERARDLARAAGAPALEAWALSFLGVIAEPTDPASAAALGEAIRLHRALQNPMGLVDACINLGDRRLALGDLPAARAAFEEALAVCRQVGSYNEEAFSLLNLAATALEAGQAPAAREAAARAHRLAMALEQGYPAGYGRVLEAQAAWRQGDYAAARALVAEGLELAARTRNAHLGAAARLAAAGLALELGELEAAGPRADQAIEAARALGDPPTTARALMLKARLETHAGRPEAARALLAEAAAIARPAGAALVLAQLGLQEALLDPAVEPLEALERKAAELQAGELRAEAAFWLGERLRAAGRPDQALMAYQRARAAAREGGLALLAALANQGVARSATGAEAADARAEARRALHGLAAAAGEGFFAWPERQPDEAAPPAGGGSAGLAEALGMLADLRAAESLTNLLDRVLGRALEVAGAPAGALLAYREHQLEAYVRAFLSDADVLEKPALDAALWFGEAAIAPGAWTLPAFDAGEVVAVLYVEDGQPGREELLRHLAEAIGFVVGQFLRLARYQGHVQRLAFSEALARKALAAPDAATFLPVALQAALEATGAERAFVVLADGSRPAALRADGQPLAPDAPISQSVVRHVLATQEAVRLLDPQHEEGWSQQQSILALGLQTIVAVPLPAGAGVLYVDSGNVARVLGPHEQDLLAAAAAIVGAVLAR